MPVKFEWQAEQEHEWTEEQDVTPGGSTAVSLRKYWRIWLALLGLFIVIGGGAYALLNRQAEETSHLISSDVLASHQLVSQTVARRDSDVFATLLFPYSREWAEVQRQLFDRQMFWDRVPLGLWAAPQQLQAEPRVILAPDLQSAVVEIEMPYTIELGDMVTETVVLVETAVYEQNEGQWQLAPPDDAFWGPTVTAEGERLDVSFPSRDTEVGQRLAADLDELLADFCRLPDSNCAASFRLSLLLETDYSQLLALERDYQSINPRRIGGGMMRLQLPAPTLVGRPLDEAGYRALYRGYAGWITAVLSHEFNRSVMPNAVIIARILAQIDLRPPPTQRERPWQQPPQSPIPYPQQDILTICEGVNQSLEIWQYSLVDSTWTELTDAFNNQDAPQPTWGILHPMPDDEGAILLLNQFNTEVEGQLFLWRDGVATRLLADAPGFNWIPSFYLLPAMDTDRFLTFYETFVEDSVQIKASWLNLAACPGPACQLQSGDRLIYQSPDGGRSLLLGFSNYGPTALSLGDAAGTLVDDVGNGWSPLWLDENTLVYVRPDPALDLEFFVNNSGETELVWADAADAASVRTMVTSTALRDVLPEFGRPVHLSILSAVPHPRQPEAWIIHTTTSLSTAVPRRDFWFSFDAAADESKLLLELKSDQIFGTRIEGNGRYLTTTGLEEDGTPVYFVHDLERGQTYSYQTLYIGPTLIDWSADGNWFVLAGDKMLRLVAPGSRYERPLFHGQDQCAMAVWVNR